MVYLLLEDGFEMCEALTPVDILRRGGVDVATVGVTKMTVTSSHGVSVCADKEFSEISVDEAEMLIIPGGQPGVDNLWENEEVRKLVSEVRERNIPISAICAAPIILARLGILNDKTAVCYPSCSDELEKADYIGGAGVARDEDIITGRAAGDAFDFAFEILAFLRGEDVARKIKDAVCYE